MFGEDGFQMMLKNLGFDPDSIMDKIKESLENNPEIEKIKHTVVLFARGTHERIVAIEASQLAIHSKLDAILEGQKTSQTANMLEATSPIIPAGDDGLLALLEKETGEAQPITLLSQPKPKWAEELDVKIEEDLYPNYPN